ncbi:hypothetical protein F396_gp45 [Pectobacterium phage ZF40]|uniref:structural cement protein Gp24 n=1 Tax=Pectobacterium TaxID=122277 RepID=UPI0002536E78|nr:hypothetical protein [Pectobacterium carotovorum]YP_007006954.1 hypothetical protein F396_gp45 [Pectobacterium phage ZF40]AFC22497.1 hypothetical protein ZF40_0045 [Pectobacterium phage ZF40]ULS51781.1 hypothetical protein GBN63_19275 [Pectobacterium carotovorum]
MAIAQDSFSLYRGKAYEGQISTTDVVGGVISRKVETALVQFGRAVIRGVEKRSCAPVGTTTTAADIIGFSVRSMATSSPTPPANPANYVTGYAVDSVASILRHGSMFALCVDGADAGEAISVILTAGENQGRLTSGTGAGLLVLNQVKWVEDVAAGEVGEIRVDGILNVSA